MIKYLYQNIRRCCLFMADKKYWGMRVHTRGKRNGIMVKQMINGDFSIYQIKNEKEFALGNFSRGDLFEETGSKIIEKFKNKIKHYACVRVVDITITPEVRRTLMSMAD